MRATTKKSKGTNETYLKIPNHILSIEGLNYGQKQLLAHIYSFGRKGCWNSNETLGKMFHRSSRTITDWIVQLKKGQHILWVHGKGFYRTLYAKTHPDVKEAISLVYRGKEIPKVKVISGQAESALLSRKLPGELAENCEVTWQKSVIPLSRKLLHTNNTTKKDTNRDTATPAPLPAGGQAPALLEHRKEQDKSRVKDFLRHFGNGPRSKQRRQLTPEEWQRSKVRNLRALYAGTSSQE